MQLQSSLLLSILALAISVQAGVGDPSPCCLKHSGSRCLKLSDSPQCAKQRQFRRRALIDEYLDNLEARDPDIKFSWNSHDSGAACQKAQGDQKCQVNTQRDFWGKMFSKVITRDAYDDVDMLYGRDEE